VESSIVDVLVVGGGTAGVIAGIVAARNGAETIIVEKQECLGGMFTAGMLGILVCFSDKERVIVKGIPWEIRSKMDQLNALVEENVQTDAYTIYDPEAAKVVCDELAENQSNLTIYLNTLAVDSVMKDNKIVGVIIQAGLDRRVILAKQVVDCSGDAVVAYLAGARYELRPKEKLQPVTLMAKVGNVDVKKVEQYYKTHPPKLDPYTNPAWFGYKTFPGFSHWGLKDELEEINLPPHLNYLKNWVIELTSTPYKGEILLNTTGEINVDGIDFKDVSYSEIVSRRRIREALEALRISVPGFENAHVANTASLLGVRESRRIKGEYKVTFDDFKAARDFEDTVARSATAAGLHTPDGKEIKMIPIEKGKSLGIPYRCMVPEKVDNLLVAGRCVDYHPDVADTMRTMIQCMAMGQATGTAAAMAAKKGIIPRKVNYQELRGTLKEQGAVV